MKNVEKRRVIIGYRYDESNNSMNRLHQIKIENQELISDHSKNYLQKNLRSEDSFSSSLRSENLLLKAQISRLQNLTSFKSYQVLADSYFQIQNECAQLKRTIQTLQTLNLKLKSQNQKLKKQNYRKIPAPIPLQKSEKSSQSQNINISHQRNASETLLREDKKYTFSPFYPTNQNIPENKSVNDKEKDSSNMLWSFTKNYEVNQSQQSKSNDFLRSQQQMKINIQDFRGIDSDYLYNKVLTVDSQKSQQLQSVIQLDKNFSFMPKPIKKNIQTLKHLSQQNKKVKFSQQTKILNSQTQINKKLDKSSQKSMSIDFQMQTHQKKSSQKTNLNGLRRLPQKSITFFQSNKNKSKQQIV